MNTANPSPAVLQERRGAALWLLLNRPEVLNGMDQSMLTGLQAGFDAAESDSSVRVVVISAVGRAFCAGADLGYIRSLGNETAPEGSSTASIAFLQRTRAVLDRIESFRKPVIAAVNGIAVGGGLELLLVCDLVLASKGAKIGDGHSVYGQIPGGGASTRLVRRLGQGTAKHLMFTGRLHPAEHFAGTDLLVDVVEPTELANRVGQLVDELSARSPLGLAAMKKLANAAFETPQAVALTRELEATELHQHSADWREGISAFTEKRTPDFTGR